MEFPIKALWVCGGLSFLLFSSASSKQPNIPIIYDSEFQQIVDEVDLRRDNTVFGVSPSLEAQLT